MSISAISWALKVKTGSPTTKLVLIKLADNANDDGQCWPSIRHISEQTELSERAVREHIKALVGLGFVRLEKRYSEGVQLPNVYHLELRQTVGVVHEVQGVGAGGAPPVVHEVQGNSKPSSINLQSNLLESNNTKPSQKHNKTRIPENCPDEADQSKAVSYWTLRDRPDLCSRLADIAAKFRAHHRSKGTRMEDWKQAWITWYSRALEYEQKPRMNGNGKPKNTALDTFIQAGASIINDLEQRRVEEESVSDRVASETGRPLLETGFYGGAGEIID